MTTIKMDLDSVATLENHYHTTIEKLRGTGLRITSSMAEFVYLFPQEANQCFHLIGAIIEGLVKDRNDITWRKEWMEKANSEIDLSSLINNPVVSKLEHLSNKELLTRFESSILLPFQKIPSGFRNSVDSDYLEENLEISDQELSELLYEMARRALIDEKFSQNLDIQKLDALFWRVYFDIRDLAGSKIEAETLQQQQALHLLPLAVLLSSQKDTSTLSNYLLPTTTDHNSYMQLAFLGMLVGTANFSPSFLAEAGAYMLDSKNHFTASQTFSQSEIKGKHFLAEAIRNPTKAIFEQLDQSFEGYLEFFTNPALGAIEIDVDLLTHIGVDFETFFFNGIERIQQASLESPEIRAQISDALPSLGLFMYRNYSELSKYNQYSTASAKLLSLYIPEIRTMATQTTIPLLSPILSNPEAMVIFSGAVATYSISHLQKAMEIEFDSGLKAEEKQRLIATHTDAVSDIHYHLFSAISLDKDNYESSSATFFETLKFTGQYLLPIIAPKTRLGITGLIFANKKINEYIVGQSSEQLESAELLTPTEIFNRQIMNRKYAQSNSSYPEPTWFEIELASLILENKPEVATSLKTGKWFDGQNITPPNSIPPLGQNIEITNTQQILENTSTLIDKLNNKKETQGFAEWFAKSVNADPPTEFSSNFTHLQREFGRDILLDALSIEVDVIRKEARIAKTTADLALQNYHQNLRRGEGSATIIPETNLSP